jgi:hypothetical protein
MSTRKKKTEPSPSELVLRDGVVVVKKGIGRLDTLPPYIVAWFTDFRDAELFVKEQDKEEYKFFVVHQISLPKLEEQLGEISKKVPVYFGEIRL